jgi:outer membrane protein assembly factor BamA
MHYGRYGADGEDPHLAPIYVGYPDLVHGYGIGSFSNAECEQVTPRGLCSISESLLGSRLLVANLEVRAPLIGLFRRELTYGRVPVEVAAFTDAGVTWTAATKPAFLGGTREIVRSYGGAVRLNAFGILVL